MRAKDLILNKQPGSQSNMSLWLVLNPSEVSRYFKSLFALERWVNGVNENSEKFSYSQCSAEYTYVKKIGTYT